MDMTIEERDEFKVQAAEIITAVTDAFDLRHQDHNQAQCNRAVIDVAEVLIKQSQQGRPEVTREADNLLQQVLNRHSNRTSRAGQKLEDMYWAAHLMGGPALRSFIRCLNTIDRFEAEIHIDTCALSLTWQGGGLFGGFIFHPDSRDWSIHT